MCKVILGQLLTFLRLKLATGQHVSPTDARSGALPCSYTYLDHLTSSWHWRICQRCVRLVWMSATVWAVTFLTPVRCLFMTHWKDPWILALWQTEGWTFFGDQLDHLARNKKSDLPIPNLPPVVLISGSLKWGVYNNPMFKKPVTEVPCGLLHSSPSAKQWCLNNLHLSFFPSSPPFPPLAHHVHKCQVQKVACSVML